MSVETRGNSVTIRYRDARGKLVRETLGPKTVITIKEAKRIEQQRILDVHRSQYVHPAAISFRGLAAQWFEYTATAKSWAPRTERAYKRSLKRLKRFDRELVGDIRRRHIEVWVDDMLEDGYSGKTIGFDLSTIKAVLDFGVAREYLHRNPAEKPPRPKVKRKEWRILKPEEVQQVEKSFDDDIARLVFKTLVRTGLRRGELQNLRVEDIDWDRSALRVEKSKTEEGERWIALSPALLDALRSRCDGLQPVDYVFAGPDGGRLNTDKYSEAFRGALKKAGIDDYVRPFHDMRHTSLTNEAAVSGNPVALMARAGHRSFATTRQYLKLAGVLFPEQAQALDELYGGGDD